MSTLSLSAALGMIGWLAFSRLPLTHAAVNATRTRNRTFRTGALASICGLLLACASTQNAVASSVTVFGTIPNEPISSNFSVTVNPGTGAVSTPVYKAAVEEWVGYSTNLPKSGTASFTNFDFSGSVTIVATNSGGTVTSAVVLPASAGITPTYTGDTATFTITTPGQYVLETNNEQTDSLQIFANAGQTGVPANPGSSDYGTLLMNYPTSGVNLLYYGPGTYKVYGTQVIPANTTVFVDGGAAVYGYPAQTTCQSNYVPPDYPCPPPCVLLNPCSTDEWNSAGCSNTTAAACFPAGAEMFELNGSGIVVLGRGIIDGSNYPRLGSNNIIHALNANGLQFSGVTLRDSGSWTLHLDESDGTSTANILITNIKEYGWRLNSDGVDINSSQYVTLSNSFIRTFDDLVAVKTNHSSSSDTTANVTVTGMVLWNQKAHAFTVGTELYQNVSNVTFTDSNIIRDTGHDWLMSVDNGEGGTVSDITFSNITVGQVEGLITLTMPWVSGGNSSPTPGNINNITFSSITSPTPPSSVPQPNCPSNSDTCTAGTARTPNPPATLTAYGAYDGSNYEINTVTFTADKVDGSYLTSSQVSYSGPYVTDVTIEN